MNKTVLVIGIIFLLIGASVVSSTEHTVEDSHMNYHPIESIDVSKETVSRGKIAYSYIAYAGGSGHPIGPCYFDLDDPGTLTSFTILNCPDFGSATWTNNGKWLVCDETGALWEINLCDDTALKIGGGGVSLNGLAYNPVNEKLYGASSSDLYEINMSTGEQTYIGTFGLSGKTIIAIAINIEGQAFIWDILFTGNSHLWTVDLETGEATEYADMGENLCYAQDGHFDWETNILWLSAYSITGFLAYWDDDAKELVHIGNFQGGAELCALAIPHADDFCPPNTTISFDPPEPDGCNGWYVSDVNVTLNATDDMSGVKEIRYTINDGPEQVISGNHGIFILHDDGDNILVKYWAIDNAGNAEPKNTFTIDMDQTPPYIELTYEVTGNSVQGWDLLFTATATDAMSGMNRVEFYLNDEWQETVTGPGPTYEWVIPMIENYSVTGFICNRKITEENISFFALIVWTDIEYSFAYWEDTVKAIAYDNAGNLDYDETLSSSPPPNLPVILRHFNFRNNYEGYIGRFFISARFII